MKCQCKTEPRVLKGVNTIEDGKRYRKIVFTCDNPNCINYRKEIGEIDINLDDEREVIEKSY